MYPRKLSDIFKGTQLTILGRYRNASDIENVTLRLQGKTGREVRTFNYTNLDFPARAGDNDFLPRLWATRRVGWLVEQIRSNGDNKELRDEIVDLGTRYGIVTPYTSYLATDGSERSMGFGSGNSPRDRKSMSNSPAPAKVMAQSGADAVTLSKKVREQQENNFILDGEDEAIKTGAVKKVGIKTFYLENGVWIDSEFKETAGLPEVKVKFAADNYFDLVAKEKELAQFFSLGEQVVVVWKGKIYRVTQ
jgi:Ca-activated chloride channel family protein